MAFAGVDRTEPMRLVPGHNSPRKARLVKDAATRPGRKLSESDQWALGEISKLSMFEQSVILYQVGQEKGIRARKRMEARLQMMNLQVETIVEEETIVSVEQLPQGSVFRKR